MVKIAPSLLASDYLRIGENVERVAAAGADWLHFDVMDGSFVPTISFGQDVLRQVAKCRLPVDAHLMVVHPERHIDLYAAAGAQIITVHAEATNHLHRALQMIRAAGCKAGVALNPATSPDCLRYVMGDFDLALVMTVNPGYGGQTLIPACIDKVAELRAMLDAAGCDAIIEVDGGVNTETAVPLMKAGATMLVAGSALFGAPDARAFIESIRESERKLR